jgi:hypothetical protein
MFNTNFETQIMGQSRSEEFLSQLVAGPMYQVWKLNFLFYF